MNSIGVEGRILKGDAWPAYRQPIQRIGLEFPSLVSSSGRCIPIAEYAGLSGKAGRARLGETDDNSMFLELRILNIELWIARFLQSYVQHSFPATC